MSDIITVCLLHLHNNLLHLSQLTKVYVTHTTSGSCSSAVLEVWPPESVSSPCTVEVGDIVSEIRSPLFVAVTAANQLRTSVCFTVTRLDFLTVHGGRAGSFDKRERMSVRTRWQLILDEWCENKTSLLYLHNHFSSTCEADNHMY